MRLLTSAVTAEGIGCRGRHRSGRGALVDASLEGEVGTDITQFPSCSSLPLFLSSFAIFFRSFPFLPAACFQLPFRFVILGASCATLCQDVALWHDADAVDGRHW